ncbi:hypothetical protein [Streptomyces sp. NPDC020681]|uniref:hypothetical protein n=1 Tax=Streptomyces sp. NPDC020681 TaxID=3365083 RepID=UPI0037893422
MATPSSNANPSEPEWEAQDWTCAQAFAYGLISRLRPTWRRASMEFRATHDVLTLTLLFIDRTDPAQAMRCVRELVEHDVEWAVWCQAQLICPQDFITTADLDKAERAWQWLAESCLLGGELLGECSPGQASVSMRGVGVALGVAGARELLLVL